MVSRCGIVPAHVNESSRKSVFDPLDEVVANLLI